MQRPVGDRAEEALVFVRVLQGATAPPSPLGVAQTGACLPAGDAVVARLVAVPRLDPGMRPEEVREIAEGLGQRALGHQLHPQTLEVGIGPVGIVGRVAAVVDQAVAHAGPESGDREIEAGVHPEAVSQFGALLFGARDGRLPGADENMLARRLPGDGETGGRAVPEALVGESGDP